MFLSEVLQKLRISYTRYYSFCELRRSPPFPVRERILPGRSSIFNPADTFSNYVGFGRETCFFSQEPLRWGTSDVKNAIASLKMKGKGKYRSPNFIGIDIAIRIRIRDSRGSPFAQMAYISFLYALRVPSDAPLLRRAFRNDDLTSFAPMKSLSLVAIRGENPNK